MDHPLRRVLNDEIHGRPALLPDRPGRMTHFAFTLSDWRAAREAIAQLCRVWEAPEPAPDARHHLLCRNGITVKWERHAEFYTLGIAAPGTGGPAFDRPAATELPADWLASLPGERLVALNIAVLADPPAQEAILALFGHDDLAGSTVNGGTAAVWTDFRIGPDGYCRAIVADKGLTDARRGRLLRRLVEIETYRMMALLGFPLATGLQADLGRLEAAVTASIAEASVPAARGPGMASEADILARLQASAREVEETANATNFRFAATRAYGALVRKRIGELREERIEGLQRIETFLDRRFGPALATCEAAERRLAALADRCERASNLLRTRVDIALEAQNQNLLRSMEQSARQQLRLQQTVEGLSVVAISYYLLAIAGRLFEGAEAAGVPIHASVAEALAAPVVILAVWLGIRRLRRGLDRG